MIALFQASRLVVSPGRGGVRIAHESGAAMATAVRAGSTFAVHDEDGEPVMDVALEAPRFRRPIGASVTLNTGRAVGTLSTRHKRIIAFEGPTGRIIGRLVPSGEGGYVLVDVDEAIAGRVEAHEQGYELSFEPRAGTAVRALTLGAVLASS